MPASSYNGTLRALRKKIHARREALGLTQEEMAERLHITTRHYQKIEAGALNITLRTLCKVADALHVPPSELINRG